MEYGGKIEHEVCWQLFYKKKTCNFLKMKMGQFTINTTLYT